MIRTVLFAIGAVLLAAYLGLAVFWSGQCDSRADYRDVQVEIVDSVGHGFVTRSEMIRELSPLPAEAPGARVGSINLDSVNIRLNAMDKLEWASVVRLTDNTIRVRISPMHPVARIWEGDSSYYINRSGKRIAASARFHMDVPVVTARFDNRLKPMQLIPLIDYITADSLWNSLVTMIKVNGHNVYLLPSIRGHIVNFGSPDDIDDKFRRLRGFYSKVMPVKGWEFYDTISVKWKGQIVATRRHNKLPPPQIMELDDDADNDVSADNMSTDVVDKSRSAQSEQPSTN